MHRSNSAELLNKDACPRFSRRGLFLVAASAASAFFQLTDRLHAVTVDTWTNTGGGIWTATDDSDWKLSAPPASADSVDIGANVSSNVAIHYDYTASAQTFNTVTVDSTGGGAYFLELETAALGFFCANAQRWRFKFRHCGWIGRPDSKHRHRRP